MRNPSLSQLDILNGSDVGLFGPQGFSLDPLAGTGATWRGKTIAGLDRVVTQIDSGTSLHAPNGIVTYHFLDKDHLLGVYNNPNNGFTSAFGLSAFSAVQQAEARNDIALWDDLIPLTFRETNGNGADIQLANSLDPAQAYAFYPGNGQKYHSDVFINDPYADNVTNLWFGGGGYGTTTLIHELGHTLGLSHPGAYNFGPGFAVNYVNGAEYAQDSMQYSIMSYWSGSETAQISRNWLTGQANYPQTPMIHDILTIQAKYGADPTTRVGDTTYGFNSTAGRDVYDFAKNPYPNIAIYDAGGKNDTIDLSGFTAGNFLDLHAGSFSSVGQGIPTLAAVNAARAALGVQLGITINPTTQFNLDASVALRLPTIESNIAFDTGGVRGVNATEFSNLSIAYGTTIENGIGGSARDVLWGNQVANVLKGGGGNDVIDGFEGADTLYGGTGNDTFVFHNKEFGDRIMDWNAGDKIDLKAFGHLTFLGGAAFTNHAGEVHYTGGVLSADFNGDGVADFAVSVIGSPMLGAADLLII